MACDITTVSWQRWEWGAEQGRTVNPRICLNVSSEKPPCLTLDTLMALTSTDLSLTCYAVSLWLCLFLWSVSLFSMCLYLKQLSPKRCRCALTLRVTWCERKLAPRFVTRWVLCLAVAMSVRQSTFVWTAAGHVTSQFSQVLLAVEETFTPTLHHLNEVMLKGHVKWYCTTNGSNRVKWRMKTIHPVCTPYDSLCYRLLPCSSSKADISSVSQGFNNL